MTPVGGSRHYTGGGLGHEGMWGCPSCGEDNLGPINQGCTHCGAGKPGHRAAPLGSAAAESVSPGATPPPGPPRVSERTPDDPTYRAPQATGDDPHEDIATGWAKRHPDKTLAEAFIAGYIEGVRDAERRHTARQAHAHEPAFAPQWKQARTLIAALELFRDQVLSGVPDDVTDGEWLSAAEVTAIINRLHQEIEGVHV